MQYESKLKYLTKRIWGMISPPIEITTPPSDIIIEKDILVVMRDKIKLSVNIFRPNNKENNPVIICFHPYNKDILPKNGLFGFNPTIGYRVMRQPGDIKMSALTSWKSPDPAFWVTNGYVLINADTRGFGKSEGEGNVFSDLEAKDYYDLIEWAAGMPWSNGKIGLSGVSYLAISQYKVAALQPPHLFAICPWEGFSDFYRDLSRPGGIREDGMVVMWSKLSKTKIREESYDKQLRDSWYKALAADLEKINVPALVCGSFSDQCLHSRGSFRVFNKISSKHKWLYTHRGGKWASYYSEEALSFQLKFFDYFLKGVDNNLLDIPPVRLEVRETRDHISKISYHSSWPLTEIKWQKFYLDNSSSTLNSTLSNDNIIKSFDNLNGLLSFDWKVPYNVTIAGPMKLQIYIELEGCLDVNIFVGIDKVRDNMNIPFEGSYGFGLDNVTKGWQKASLRYTDNEKGLPWEAHHTFDKIQLLEPKQIVCLEVNLLPSATLFRKNEVLRLNIQGHWLFKKSKLYSQIGDYEPSPSGKTKIHSGGQYNSYLLIPVLE